MEECNKSKERRIGWKIIGLPLGIKVAQFRFKHALSRVHALAGKQHYMDHKQVKFDVGYFLLTWDIGAS